MAYLELKMAILRPKEAIQRLKVAIQRPIVAIQQLCQEAKSGHTDNSYGYMQIPEVAI